MACACSKRIAVPASDPQLPLDETTSRRVYAFHAHTTGVAAQTVELWARTWAAHGWSPHVLGFADARPHPLYARLSRSLREDYPGHQFDYIEDAYLRWLSYELVAPAVFAVPQLMNHGLKPSAVPRLKDGRDYQPRVIALAGSLFPHTHSSLFVANVGGIQLVINLLLAGKYADAYGDVAEVTNHSNMVSRFVSCK